MNLLEEIQNAPVEWKELGEVCEIKNGKNVNKSFIQNNSGQFPVINSGKEPLGFVNVFNVENDPIGITSRGAGVGYVSWNEGKYFRGNLNYSASVRNVAELLPRFLYFYLKNNSSNIEKLCTFNGIPALNKSNLETLSIPILPLEIQEKIVQTLDKFTDYVTELTSELTSELTLRQKQYSYFRDYLLNFDQDSSGRTNNKVEWKTLGEVCLSTKTISWKSEDEQKQFKYIDLSSVSRENKKITDVTIITKSTAPSRAQKIIKKDDILFATTRPMLKRFTKVTKEYNYQICSTGFCVLRPSDKILSNYLYHLVASSNFYDYVERNQSGTSYPAISDNLVKNYQFPLPPLSIQEKIVHVLDNFDTVCNDLNIGLPKEIELRQKQYEYFRDQLLTYTAEGVYTDSTVQTRPN